MNNKKYREMNNEKTRRYRAKKRFIREQEAEMKAKFDKMKPSLYKWATFFAEFDKYFEVDELVNAVFLSEKLRNIENPKLYSKKAKWLMQNYMRKVRREDPIKRIIKDHVNKYGEPW